MWKVAKLSPGQLRDIRPEDVLEGGWFRKCDVYRGGGGYDHFPDISFKRLGKAHHHQFIVQLYGCHLDCPYCYVTREGVWGQFRQFSTHELSVAFNRAHKLHGTTVFHLMGGAPALQMKRWPELIHCLERTCRFQWTFHSDMLLTEAPYSLDTLRAITHPLALYAVDIKGLSQAEHAANTRKPFREDLFWRNLDAVERANVPYYITLTNIADTARFWARFAAQWPDSYPKQHADAFVIDLIDYEALPFVDSMPWGGRRGPMRDRICNVPAHEFATRVATLDPKEP